MFAASPESTLRELHVCVARRRKKSMECCMICNQIARNNYMGLQCGLKWSLISKGSSFPSWL